MEKIPNGIWESKNLFLKHCAEYNNRPRNNRVAPTQSTIIRHLLDKMPENDAWCIVKKLNITQWHLKTLTESVFILSCFSCAQSTVVGFATMKTHTYNTFHDANLLFIFFLHIILNLATYCSFTLATAFFVNCLLKSRPRLL